MPLDSPALNAWRALYGEAPVDVDVALAAWLSMLQMKNALDIRFMEYRSNEEAKKRDAVNAALAAKDYAEGPILAYFFASRARWRTHVDAYYKITYRNRSVLADHEGVIRKLRSWFGRYELRSHLGRWFSRKDGRKLADMLEVDEKDFGPYRDTIRGDKAAYHGITKDHQKFMGE